MGGLALLWGSPIEATSPPNPQLKGIPLLLRENRNNAASQVLTCKAFLIQVHKMWNIYLDEKVSCLYTSYITTWNISFHSDCFIQISLIYINLFVINVHRDRTKCSWTGSEVESRRETGFGPAQLNKQRIWSAAPCVASHQLNNIKAVLHVKPAHFSHKLEFGKRAAAQQGGALTGRQTASFGQQGDINRSFWWWWADVLGDQKDG